jgi:hypothetical protein
LEKGLLDVGELAVWVPGELLDHRVDNVLHAGTLDIVPVAVEVLVNLARSEAWRGAAGEARRGEAGKAGEAGEAGEAGV